MKRLIILTSTVLLLAGCSENKDIQQWFPSEYNKILYILDSGSQNITVYKTGEDDVHTFSVCKAGSDPSLSADAKIGIASQEEVDAEYSDNEGVTYKILPESTYSIEPSDLTFDKGETSKQVTVSIHPDELATAMQQETGVKWILPLKLESSSDSVNSTKNDYSLIVDDVISPQVGFDVSGPKIFVHDFTSGAFSTTTNFGLLDVDNKWDITANLAVYKDYATAINQQYNVNCQLPDEGTYSFDSEVSLEAGKDSVPVNITISDFGDNTGGIFILPIRISEVSKFDINQDASVYAPIIRLVGQRYDRSTWSVTGCTEEVKGEGSTGRFKDVLDGNTSTYWHSSWKSSPCDPPHFLVVDTKSEHTFTQVGIVQRLSDKYGYCVHNYDVLVGNELTYDLSKWTYAGTCTAQKSSDEQIGDITPTTGRYVALYFKDSNRSDKRICVAELYLYGK